MTFIDTDILSYFFAGNGQIREHLSDNIKRGEQIAMTSVNVYEVLKGLKHRNNISKEQQFMAFLKAIVYSLLIMMRPLKLLISMRSRGKTAIPSAMRIF